MLNIDLSEAILATEGTFYRSLFSASNLNFTDVVKLINLVILGLPLVIVWIKQTFLLPLLGLLLKSICRFLRKTRRLFPPYLLLPVIVASPGCNETMHRVLHLFCYTTHCDGLGTMTMTHIHFRNGNRMSSILVWAATAVVKRWLMHTVHLDRRHFLSFYLRRWLKLFLRRIWKRAVLCLWLW